MLVKCLDVFAAPICRIFNAITAQESWPALWKIEYVTVIFREYVTVISKNMSSESESESECRNISCTNFLSKIYERIVLTWCQEYVQTKNNQFGGQKGCSTYHFLAETIDQVTEHLEDSRAASILTSIDYSKAFNRIEHLPLLQSFAQKGAPNHILRVLTTFLSDRQMTVKVDNCFSSKRQVNAGAPQGSV